MLHFPDWETLPEICCVVSGALAQALKITRGLEVDAERMARNLDLTHGLVLAEAVSIVLAQAGVELSAVEAIAFGRGPGVARTDRRAGFPSRGNAAPATRAQRTSALAQSNHRHEFVDGRRGGTDRRWRPGL